MNFFRKTPTRILSVVECTDGSVFAVEMQGPDLGFELLYRPGTGAKYLGEGRWEFTEWMAAMLRAGGHVRTEYVADWVAWMQDRAGKAPETADLPVYAPLALDPGGNG